MKLLVLALVLSLARPAAADCASEAARLRAHLEVSADAVSRWNWGWAIGFGGAAAAQAGLAAAKWNPFGTFDAKYRDTLLIGAAKATLGAGSRVVLPLRVRIPAKNDDHCAEVVALRAAVTDLAKKERSTFWLTHLGGIALNATGAAVLWKLHSFKTGAVSFLISFPVGPVCAYTMPRATWHLWREESPTWAVATDLGAGSN